MRGMSSREELDLRYMSLYEPIGAVRLYIAYAKPYTII